MSAYINTKTMEYPLYQGDIRLVYPEIGEAFILPDDTFAAVEDTPVPSYGINERLVELKPILVNGKWVKQFTIRDMTQEEIDERESYFLLMQPPHLRDSGSAPNVIE